MKVAIVHDYLNQRGGAERILDIFCEMFPDAPIYTLLADESTLTENMKKHKIHQSFISKLPFAKRHYKKYLLLFPTAIEQFDLSDFDLVISSSSAFAKGVITKPDTIHICYCYTPIRYAWDLYYQYLGQDGPKGLYRKILPIAMNYIRMWDQVTVDRVDHFIAISQYIKKRIKKYYRRDAEVIYPAIDVTQFNISDKVSDYFLIVSRLLPYKRVDIAIEAANELNLPLVIIGDGYDSKRLRKMAGPTVQFLGYQPDHVIKEYYSKAKAFIFPGDEDFGLTPVEAQASGRPVIAYAAGGALETVVDGITGLFFREQTKESLVDALKRFDSNSFDPHKIREHAKQFDKEVFKKRMFQYITSIYNSG